MTTRRGPAGRTWQARSGPDTPSPAKADEPPAGGPRRLDILLPGARAVPGSSAHVSSLSELTPAQAKQRWDEVEVHAPSLAALRQALPWLGLAGRTRRLVVRVAATDRPELLRVPAAVGRRVPTTAELSRAETGLHIGVELAKHTEVAMIARAVLDAGLPAFSRTAGLRVGLTGPEALVWAVGDPTVGAALGPVDPALPAAHDVLVGPNTLHVDPRVPRVSGGLPPVDTVLCAPRGFCAAGPEVALLDRDGTLRWADAERRIESWTGLTENDIAALRAVRAVRVADGLDPRVVAQLCCAGIPVCAKDPGLDAALGLELTARLRTLDPDALADPIDRESWSIDTRRLALARFAPAARWAATAAALGVPTRPKPTVSVLVATRRTALLPFALAQIARQDWADLQVVLVLHGPTAADPVVADATVGFPRPLQIVEVGADVVFGRALNIGLDHCAGDLVTKFDDDDWYGPAHITDLVQAHEHSGALLVGCGGYYVYLAGPDVTIRWTHVPTEAATTWVHGGTILLERAALRALGGFAAVPVGEDAVLLTAVRTAGGAIYGIHDLGFCYFRGRDHTWIPAEGDTRWLDTDAVKLPGFAPPPQLDPMPHPWR